MNMLDLIRDNYWVFMAVYGVCLFVAIVYMSFFRRRGRVLIRVKTPLKEFRRWIKPHNDGKTIIMEKGKGKKPEWRFTYTKQSVVPFSHWFSEKKAIDVFYESEHAIEYNYPRKITVQPRLTKEQIRVFALMEAMKQRYSKLPKLPLPSLFWVVLIGIVVNVILTLMMMQGVRF